MAGTVIPPLALAEGILFTGSVLVSGVQNSTGLLPVGGQQALEFVLNSTQAGTVQVFRVDPNGATRSQQATTAVVANTELHVTIVMPLRCQYYIQYINTSGSTATVTMEGYSLGGPV